MLDGPHDPPSHILPTHLEPRVDGDLHEVELGQDVVGEVQAPVGPDVHFAARQHPESLSAAC